MVFEKVKIKIGDTISKIACDYGYFSWEWRKIWNHRGNYNLRRKRIKPENILFGDIIIVPIPWKIIKKEMLPSLKTFSIDVVRNGNKGKNLRWVQTVYQDNQPIGATSTFCADACPGDDDEPFYYTKNEIIADNSLVKNFYDTPNRRSPIDRTTTWRAVLSICTIFESRVSIFESITWGIDFTVYGINKKFNPRYSTPIEIQGHLNILKKGRGATKTFKNGGWIFQEANKYI